MSSSIWQIKDKVLIKPKKELILKEVLEKLKNKKVLGTARAGSIKSGVFRGGGRIFGPRPRDYEVKLNKKLKRIGWKSALTLKAQDKAIKVIEDFDFKAPKTKMFIDVLKALNIEDKKSLIVFGAPNNNVYLSSRNFKGSEVVTSSEISTYKILNAKELVISESSLLSINENLSK